MSKVNGEKARAAIAKRNRTARRMKTRALRAEMKGGAAEAAPKKEQASK